MFSLNKEPRHVYDVVKPLLFLSKVFGFSAFEMTGKPPYVQLEVTRANYASLLLNFLANSLCVFLNIQDRRLSMQTGSVVIDNGMNFLFPFGAVIMFVLAVDTFFRRKSTCAIIAAFFEVDRSLQRKNVRVEQKRHLQVLTRILVGALSMIILGTLFSLLMILFSSFSVQNHFINAYSYFYTGIEFFIINFQFICAGRLVAFRLNDIDRCMRRHVASGVWFIEQKSRWGRPLESIDVVDELAGDAAALVHIVDRINRFYANQILGCILGVAMFTIFIIYTSAYSFYSGVIDELTVLTAIVLTAWLFYLYMIVHIFIAGVQVAHGGRAIILTVHEAMLIVGDRAMEKKLLSFSQQMLLQAPTLQSLFCDFNLKTMFGISGFIVTYLVILMQFDSASIN